MLKIRLKRVGRKKKPFYRIVLMESLSRRDGKSIAEIGYYDPIKKIIACFPDGYASTRSGTNKCDKGSDRSPLLAESIGTFHNENP